MTNFFRKRKLPACRQTRRVFSVAVFLVVLCSIFFQNPKNTFADSYKGIHYYSVNGTYTSADITDGFFGGSVYDKNLYFTPTYSHGGQYLFQGTDLKYYYTSSDPAKGDTAIYSAPNDLPLLQQYLKGGTVGPNTESAKLGATGAGAAVENDGTCSWGVVGAGSLWNCLMQGLYYLLFAVSFVANWVTYIFDVVFGFTVANISATLKGLTIISTGWTAVRDLANICFIFILLYLAIATILQLDEHGVKHSLSRLIIAAVLINFSLFFTQVVIDIPNILSIQIYNSIVGDKGGGVNGSGIGSAFLTILKPEKYLADAAQGTAPEGLATNSPAQQVSPAAAQLFAAKSPLTTFVMMIILYVVICAVFLAASVIFIKRFVMLIFYMVFSPLAFAGMAIPIHSLQSAAKEKFWNGLIKEAFYAPIFMMCAYLALVTGKNAYGMAMPATQSATFSGTIITFGIVIVMLVASLFIAEEMGVKGASGAMSVYKGVTGGAMGAAGFMGGAAYNNTIGKVAETYRNKTHSATLFANANGLDEKGNKVGFIKKWKARGQIAVLNRAASGYQKKLDKEEHYAENMEEEFHGDSVMRASDLMNAMAKGEHSTDAQKMDRRHHKWKNEDHANIMLELKDKLANGTNKEKELAKSALDRYYTGGHDGRGRLLEGQDVDVEKMQNDKLLAFHKKQFDKGITRDTNRNIIGFTDNQAFEGLSDQQRGQLVGTYSKKDQDAMANNPAFMKMIKDKVLDYESLEKVAKGATSKAMKDVLSDVAYGGIGRRDLFDKISSDVKFKNNATLQTAFKTMLDDIGIATAGKGMDEMMTDYVSSEQGERDARFKSVKNNVARLVTTNKEYAKFTSDLAAIK